MRGLKIDDPNFAAYWRANLEQTLADERARRAREARVMARVMAVLFVAIVLLTASAVYSSIADAAPKPQATLMSWYGDGPSGEAIACGTGTLKRTAYAVAMRRDLTGARCGQRVLICTLDAPKRCAKPRVLDSGPYVPGRLIDALPQVLAVLGLDPAAGVYRVTYSLLPTDDPATPRACWFPAWVGRAYYPRCER